MTDNIKINVGVIFGGRSTEHEVSIISAHQAMAALDENKYNAIPLYISKEGRWYSGDALKKLSGFRDMGRLLSEAFPIEISVNYGSREIFARAAGLFKKPWQQRIDVAFPVVHGTNVEDGSLQGMLEMTGIPYVGPNVLASAVGMDKIMMKAALKEAGLPVVDYRAFAGYQWENDEDEVIAKCQELPYPLIVKPSNLGSSIGITRVDNKEALAEALELAFSFSRRVLVERAVTPLREINCAVLGMPGDMVTSACEEPLNAKDILSFSDKYLAGSSAKGMGGAKRRLLAEDDPLCVKIKQLAARTFETLDCCGVCRVDFLVDGNDGSVYVNEANTIPGSLSFYLLEPAGIDFSQLTDRLIRLALERSRKQARLTTVYNSNILAQGGFKGKK